ncbi:MAG: inorganic diphosphatase [Thermofilaceae archaeon]|nr:inorganic diphosphatase [Thermofilaceae archaeon]MCX8181101.1 inorganic diphosphatase [Thermofilaceae archaeon]MDW8004582.1 inorganic diphosphatase [Thermofilaceae archaeon]
MKPIGPGDKAPDEVYVVIEIPQGGSVKYEMDKESGVLFVDRILYTSMVYPFNYGFIPGTLEEDEDPVDVLVVSHDPLIPGSVILCKPVGVLLTRDEKGADAKVVAVPASKIDPRFMGVDDVAQLPEALRRKIEHFFEHYKELEPGKWVKVEGWFNREEARRRIRQAIERYKTHQ